MGAYLFWAVFAIGFCWIYPAKARSEERECAAVLGSDYAHYRAEVPAFLPLRGRVSGLGTQRFSRELYRRNREYQCIVGSLAVLGLLILKVYYVP